MTQQQEKLLIEKAKEGSSAAFEALIRMHYDKLYSFAFAITSGNRHVAEDILQEALLKAFLNIGRFREKSTLVSR